MAFYFHCIFWLFLDTCPGRTARRTHMLKVRCKEISLKFSFLSAGVNEAPSISSSDFSAVFSMHSLRGFTGLQKEILLKQLLSITSTNG
jgi:hypothetical protein